MTTEHFGLGRLPAADERDRLFSIAPLIVSVPVRSYRYWYSNKWWGDQGSTPFCVDYAWQHFMVDGPVTHKPVPIWTPGDVYTMAQRIDEWPGEDYEGTSVRAGVKVLQQLGYVQEYRWAFNIEDIVNTVLTIGPVIIGSNWYEGMFYPDSNGILCINGPVVGGHAYVLDGVNLKTKMFRIKNSWGRTWGKNGFAYISFDNLERLFNEDGEACIAMENKF